MHAILKSVAPDAQETITWGAFFVEPRFLFAFSGHKRHVNFAPTAAALEAFREELEKHETTKGTLRVPYAQPLPEDLIRRIAEFCVQELRERESDSFW